MADLTHHDSLWFEDGNVVLIAANVMFKVHRGVLSNHSDVFRDMFALVQPPQARTKMYDDCPCVVLQDVPEQLGSFLALLYDGARQ